jgi:hypothetical protein
VTPLVRNASATSEGLIQSMGDPLALMCFERRHLDSMAMTHGSFDVRLLSGERG